jgi:hypothetical protein
LNIKSQYFAEIEYIPMLDSYSSSFSKTPKTDKENHLIYIQNLKDNGFELDKKNDLLLTDNNINLLQNSILNILPTVIFKELRNWNYKGNQVIKSIKFNIQLEDLIKFSNKKI